MLPGHKRRFPLSIKKIREEMEEQEEKRKQKRGLAKLKRDRKLIQARSRTDHQVNADDNSKEGTASTETKSTVSRAKIKSKFKDLPATKFYAAFISHKKLHSKHGDSSETLAIRLKDMLKWRSYEAYFDADNLSVHIYIYARYVVSTGILSLKPCVLHRPSAKRR
jgi:hypothetical protein